MCLLRCFDVISIDNMTGKCGHYWSVTGQISEKFGQMRSFSAKEQARGQKISLEGIIFDAEHDGRTIFRNFEKFFDFRNFLKVT